MQKHKGLRLSLIGALVFLISISLLLVLPDLVPAVGMLLGGALVWGGLIWTLFGYYTSPEGPLPGP
ncbi:MAG TPA: hypothetical protein VNN10_04980 [Dehalococcoidia bacterium]|nr:hypothetical protein [Dehalococcoidia bacterium]